jgi:magnesium chelatase subunit D
MSPAVASRSDGWNDAAVAACLLAVDSHALGGAALRAGAGPVRDAWLALLRRLLPADAPMRRLPLHIADGRLLGGLDLAATLKAGRPVAERGVLADSDGGIVVAAMAERLAPLTAAHLTAVLDSGTLRSERDGIALDAPARIAIVALDEGIAEDERPPAPLLDRLAFHLDLAAIATRDLAEVDVDAATIVAARARLAGVDIDDELLGALCAAAVAFGIDSLRAPLLALRVARAAAALDGRAVVTRDDAALAARLVLAPRATRMPALDEPSDAPPPQSPDDATEPEPEPERDAQEVEETPPADVVLEATRAAIPPDLLAQLQLVGSAPQRARNAGRAGVLRKAGARGRPAGSRRGEPGGGVPINVVETLRAAAPWQRLRGGGKGSRIQVRREDFRVTRFKQRTQTTIILAVDASGSSARHRLAEAKGAAELMLAECYVRRDRVAVLGFRGSAAELVLPPTRSLARAKRSLAGMPGGGATPLAAGIDAAVMLADSLRRRGETPIVVLLTDGRGNIARDGSAGRPRAEEDALAAARQAAIAGVTALLVDTAPHPQPAARRLAEAMRARYLALPRADAAVMSRAVLNAAAPPSARTR